MDQITRTFAERIIRHELGHWIAAKVLNFQPKRFSIEFTDDHTSYQREREIGLHTLVTAAPVVVRLERDRPQGEAASASRPGVRVNTR